MQNKILVFLCYLYFLLIPLEDFFLQDIIGSPTRIAVGLIIIVYYVTGHRINLKILPFYIYFYLLIAVASVLLWANTPDYYSIFRVTMWIVTAALFANITVYISNPSKSLFKIYTVVSLYVAYRALSYFLLTDDYGRTEVEGVNNNTLGTIFLISALFCLYNFYEKNINPIMKVFSIIGFIFFIAAIVSTGSRAAILSVGLGILIILPKSLNRIGSLILTAIVSIILVFNINENNIFVKFANDRFNRVEDDKGAGRVMIWKVGEEIIIDNPILGVGFRNFPTEFKNYIDNTPLTIDETEKLGEKDYSGAHNNALEILAELGIFGFISFYMLQIVICYHLYKLFHVIPITKLLFTLIITLNFNGLFGDLTNLKMYWTIIGIASGLSYYGLKTKKVNEGSVPGLKLSTPA